MRENTWFRPPAPVPQVAPLRPLSFLRTLWNNPIEAWTSGYFERPIVTTRLAFGEVAVINDPVAIRRVLADNRDNYPKDGFQKRMLAVLSNGLLTAKDPQWRLQRRALAPVLALRNVRTFVPTMLRAAGDLLERWRSYDGEVIEIADEVTELTLTVLERTIFSDGIAGNRRELRTAMRIYFDSLGRIDPFDLLNLPDFVPRIGRLRTRAAVRLFDQGVDEMIAKRGRPEVPAIGPPQDLPTLMLSARDPQTGRRLSSAEIRANVITFMSAGHESTANAIAWTLFLLSQSSPWRERVIAEATRELAGPAETLVERLVETRAVVEEALRLYPPLAAISRVAPSSDQLAATPIRRGAMVVIAPSASPLPVVDRARVLRSRKVPAAVARNHRPLCVHALRGRAACLHRLGVCFARGDDCRRGHCQRVRACGAGSHCVAVAPHHAATAARTAHERAATPARCW